MSADAIDTARKPWQSGDHVPLGISCLALGMAAAWIARDYSYGTLTAMGPGFMPTVVAILLSLLGAGILLLGGRDLPSEPPAETAGTADQPASPLQVALGVARVMLCILGGIVFFGATLKVLGLALSTFLLVVIVRLAQRGVKPVSVLILAAATSAAACIVFVLLLNLPLPILPRVLS